MGPRRMAWVWAWVWGWAGLCLAPTWAHAENVSPIVSYQRTEHGIAGRTTLARFAIDVYSEHVVRVRVARQDAPEHRGYALIDNAAPAFERFTVREEHHEITLRTTALQVVVAMAPDLRVTFKDPDGQVINEDMPGKELGITFIGNKVTVYKALYADERFIGMGEELGDLDRRHAILTLKNTDNYRYDDPRIPMYVSIPFFTGLHDGKVYGLFFNNSYRSVFNFGSSNARFASYSFDGGILDEFFMHDGSVRSILEHYTGLTGRMPLPPKWSIGYQQSRCSYYPEAQVMFIARTFRDKHIPLDGIVLDADYLQDYESFRINTQRFPDLKRMAATLGAMHVELTASVNPGISLDQSYPAYRSGLREDVFLRYADGELYQTDIAPNTDYLRISRTQKRAAGGRRTCGSTRSWGSTATGTT